MSNPNPTDPPSQPPSLPPYSTTPYTWTSPPDPPWKTGDGLGNHPYASQWKKDEELGWLDVDPAETSDQDMYKLLSSGIVPRPIGFISSLSASGIPNLAPFSWFNMVSRNPPLVMFSSRVMKGVEKDTSQNVRETKEFTANLISEPWIHAANWASLDAPRDVNEWIGAGLTMQKSDVVKPAWVRESAFAMECEVYQIIDIPDPATVSSTHSQPNDTSPSSSPTSTIPTATLQTIFIGLIKKVHVRNAILRPNSLSVDIALYKPILRIGGPNYARVSEGFNLVTPKWGEVEERYRELERSWVATGEDSWMKDDSEGCEKEV